MLLFFRSICLVAAVDERIGPAAIGCYMSTFDIDLVLAMNDDNLARFIEVAKRHGLTPGIPVPIESLRDADQIERFDLSTGATVLYTLDSTTVVIDRAVLQ